MASSNGQVESADTTGTGIETVEVKDAAKKQTAAEKFDLVPPWVTLGNNCVASVSSDLTHWARVDGTWGDCGVPNIDRADVNRIARLTRPLPSWEPAPDCALPVEGWFVQQTPLGRWGIYANGEPALSVHDTRRAAIVWAWTEAEAPDATVATDDLEARVSKVEGVIARITPEADEQVDGKGRTLTQIDAALEDFFQWRETTNATLQYLLKRETAISHDTQSLMKWSRQDRDRLDELETSLDRLIAARVSKPCEPSKATGENELATAVRAADWREALVVEAYPDPSATRWLCTPDRAWYWNTDEWFATSSSRDRDLVDDNDETANARRTCTEPPNLREWWPAKADDFKPTPEQQRFLASVCESCRSVVRAMLAKGDIPGVVKTNQS